jgi:hypothetical protein
VPRTFEEAFGEIDHDSKADVIRYHRSLGLKGEELDAQVNNYIYDSIMEKGQFKK